MTAARTARNGATPALERPVRMIVAGVGGQGSLFASLLVGDAAVAAGINVVMSEIHGMSQRGGTVISTVILGPAHGPLIAPGDADVLIGFEPLETLRVLPYCSKKTTAVVGLQPVVPPNVSAGMAKYPPIEAIVAAIEAVCGRVIAIDAQGIAAECGAPRAANLAVLGALAAIGAYPFPSELVHDAIRRRLPAAAHEASIRTYEEGRAKGLGVGG